jgi:surface carbohydrate biosynthesis protein
VHERLILPVEIQSREMLSKLHLGARAVINGYDVIIGDQKEIVKFIHKFKPGVYLDKSIAKTKVNFFKKLHKLGFTPIALCEEGLVYRDTERYLQERFDPLAFNLVEKFFCWGGKQKSDISSVCSEIEKLKVIGNPRLDLLRPKYRELWREKTKKIKSEVGKFVLINTNFSRFNSLPGSENVIDILKRRGTFDSTNSEEYYINLVRHLKLIMKAFIETIPSISKELDEHTIIIRPHPSENVEPYYKLSRKLKNVRVDFSENVIPWLLAADVVVHNSCTTGLEGWILGRPVVTYMPIENKHFDSELPNKVSYKAKNQNDLISLIKKLVKKPTNKQNASVQKIVDEYLSGIHGGMSSDELISSLPTNVNEKRKAISFKYEFIYKLKTYLRYLPGLSLRQNLQSLGERKFPGLDETDANDFLSFIQQCDSKTKMVSIKKLAKYKNIFYMNL